MPVEVGEGELGAGVGQFAAGDHPRPGRPTGQVDEVGELGDLGPVAFVAAIGGDRRSPRPGRPRHQQRGEVLGEAVADHEPDVAGPAGVEEPVRQPGGVGAGDHLNLLRVDRELGQGGVEDGDVIGRVA